jgi:PilZ domain
MTIQARRRSPRVRLTDSACLNFGSGVRATVLDISETGLRFKAPSGFQSAGSRKLKFAFNRGGEMAADLAWTDESSMTGGLHFESVSPEVRGQIRQWLDQSWTKQRMVRGSAQPAASVVPYQPTARALDGAVFTEIQTVARATLPIKPSDAVEAPPSTTSEHKQSRLSMFSKDPHSSVGIAYFPKRARRLRQAAWVALVVVILLASATAAAGYFYPDETRDVMRRVHDTISRLFTRASGHATLNREPASAPPGRTRTRNDVTRDEARNRRGVDFDDFCNS